jgi:hypothetical protein
MRKLPSRFRHVNLCDWEESDARRFTASIMQRLNNKRAAVRNR